MEVLFFSPDGGSMPMPENVPTLLQEPITNLKKLPCIAGVTSGLLQGNGSTMLHIAFHDPETMDYKKALACLNGVGYTSHYLHINPELRFMDILISASKKLTH